MSEFPTPAVVAVARAECERWGSRCVCRTGVSYRTDLPECSWHDHARGLLRAVQRAGYTVVDTETLEQERADAKARWDQAIANYQQAQAEAEQMRENILAILDSGDKDVVRVHEGGGPEDILMSLVVTVVKLRDARDKAFAEGQSEGDLHARHPEFGSIYAEDGEVTAAVAEMRVRALQEAMAAAWKIAHEARVWLDVEASYNGPPSPERKQYKAREETAIAIIQAIRSLSPETPLTLNAKKRRMLPSRGE